MLHLHLNINLKIILNPSIIQYFYYRIREHFQVYLSQQKYLELKEWLNVIYEDGKCKLFVHSY